MAISYKDSGVDVTRGYKAVELMKKYVKTTYDDNVLGDIGSFGGFYAIAGEKMEEPVLVAGTDGERSSDTPCCSASTTPSGSTRSRCA